MQLGLTETWYCLIIFNLTISSILSMDAVQCVRRNFERGVAEQRKHHQARTSAVASSFSEVLEDEAAEAGIIESLEPKGLFLLIPKGKIQGIRRGSAKYT